MFSNLKSNLQKHLRILFVSQPNICSSLEILEHQKFLKKLFKNSVNPRRLAVWSVKMPDPQCIMVHVFSAGILGVSRNEPLDTPMVCQLEDALFGPSAFMTVSAYGFWNCAASLRKFWKIRSLEIL